MDVADFSTAVPTVTAKLAQELLNCASEEAEKSGIPMAIAVCDQSGIPKAFLRMDGAALAAVEMAQVKARSAVSFGMPTSAWFDFIQSDPKLATSLGSMEAVVPVGGGYPLKADGKVIGALGVSGGWESDDMDCAEAALKRVGLD